MDIALWKPLLATVGKDKTMKLWNISDRRIESSHVFEEEPLSISLHPNGLYAAVAFPERVQLLSLLLDGFSHMHDLNIRAVNMVKFSGGGQFVACCAGESLPPFFNPSSSDDDDNDGDDVYTNLYPLLAVHCHLSYLFMRVHWQSIKKLLLL